MVLDQEISALVRDVTWADHYKRIFEKRKCYPLHGFVNKWLKDEYKLDLLEWKKKSVRSLHLPSSQDHRVFLHSFEETTPRQRIPKL